jgi:hypothetical protein
MSSTRPSQHEILSKVEKAMEAIACGNKQIGLPHHLSSDFEDCALYDENHLWEKIPKLLDELKQANPITCYAGRKPPEKSFEPELDDLELWAYHWESEVMNCKIYLKFCIKIGRDGKPHYLHVRIHPDR